MVHVVDISKCPYQDTRGRLRHGSGARNREPCPGDFEVRMLDVTTSGNSPTTHQTLQKLNAIIQDTCRKDQAWNTDKDKCDTVRNITGFKDAAWFVNFTDDYDGSNPIFRTTVGGKILRCILDTGAGINLVSANILKTAVPEYREKLEPTNTMARSVSGKKLELIGRIRLDMDFGGRRHNIIYEVIDEGNTFILGNKFLYANDVKITCRKGFGNRLPLDRPYNKDHKTFPVYAAETKLVEKYDVTHIKVRNKVPRRQWMPLVNRPFLIEGDTTKDIDVLPSISALTMDGHLMANITNMEGSMDRTIEEGTLLGYATTEFTDGEKIVSYIMADLADIQTGIAANQISIEEILNKPESMDYKDAEIEPPGFEVDGPKSGGVYIGKRAQSMFDTERENEGSTVENAHIHLKSTKSIESLRKILKKHESIFSKHNYDIGHFMIDGVIQKVKLTLTDTTPIVEKYRMISPQKREAAMQILDQLEAAKIISRRASGFASQAVWVLKALPDITPERATQLGVEYIPGAKDPTAKRNLRFCQDYRQLNSRLQQVQWPLPSVKNVLGRLKTAKYITVLDASHSFFCIELDDQSKIYTGFQTCERHMVMNRLAMGLKCSSGILNACLARTLQGLEHCVIPYSDNILIISDDEETHIGDVDKVLTALKACNWKFKLNKCHWAVTKSLKIFGMMINLEKGTIKPDPEKSKALRELPLPKRKKQLRAFLGGIGYFVECLPDIGEHLAILQELTKHTNESKGETVIWSKSSMDAFQQVIKILNNANEIFMPDWTKPFHLVVDAGPQHTGTMLVQLSDNNTWIPLGFYYKKLSDREKKLSQVEREALAVVYGLRQTSYYVSHAKTFIHSDNKPFVLLKKYSAVNTKLARWKLWIDSFDHELVWESASSPGITFTDFLSRPPSEAIRNRVINMQDINSLPKRTIEGIFTPIQYDKILEEILSKEGGPGINDNMKQVLTIALGNTIPGATRWIPSKQAETFQHRICAVLTNQQKVLLGQPSRESAMSKIPTTPEEAIVEIIVNESPFLNLDKLRELQRSCSKLGPIYKNISQYPEFVIHDGLLLRKFTYGEINRLLMTIPVCLADDLISDLHRGTKAVHHGTKKLLQLIKSRYFIPEARKRISKIVENCGICAYYKPKGKLGGPRPDARKIKARCPRDLWSMDHIQIVSKPDEEGRTSLLCFVDNFSHFLVCKAVPKTITAQIAATVFLEEVIARYGVPRALLSDNGPDMDSELWREMANLLGIQKITISAGSAKSNGICEKIQGLVLAAIRYRAAQYRITPNNFADIAIWAALAHNSTPFQNINPPLSPAEIFLGRSISESSFFGFANAAYAYNSLEEFNKKMVAAQMTISEIINAKERYLKDLSYKKGVLKAPKWDYPIGTLVALRDKTQATQEANIKLRPRYKGVFIVVQQTDTSCMIKPYSSETILRDMETDLEANRGRGKPLPRYKVIKVDKADLKKLKHLVFYSQPLAKKFVEHLVTPGPQLDQEYEIVEEREETTDVSMEDKADDLVERVQSNKRSLPKGEEQLLPVAKRQQIPFLPEW